MVSSRLLAAQPIGDSLGKKGPLYVCAASAQNGLSSRARLGLTVKSMLRCELCWLLYSSMGFIDDFQDIFIKQRTILGGHAANSRGHATAQ